MEVPGAGSAPDHGLVATSAGVSVGHSNQALHHGDRTLEEAVHGSHVANCEGVAAGHQGHQQGHGMSA